MFDIETGLPATEGEVDMSTLSCQIASNSDKDSRKQRSQRNKLNGDADIRAEQLCVWVYESFHKDRLKTSRNMCSLRFSGASQEVCIHFLLSKVIVVFTFNIFFELICKV